jgi:ribosomal protein S18 acetylase RimI-like enzyme
VTAVNSRTCITTIRQATLGDLDAVRYVLVEAFLHGDLAGWLIPDLDTRHRIYWSYFEMLAEHALLYGRVELTHDATAVAIWHTIADGHQSAIPDYDARLKTITTRSQPRFAALDQAMHEHHPHDWHAYLAFLAVHPRHQGHGLGSALLHHHHAALDQAGTPAYLEATGARNRHLYLRHGYLHRPTYRISGDGPQLYPLWRPPASQQASVAS